MTEQDNQLLERYLKDLESYMDHVSVLKKYEILKSISEEIQEMHAQSNQSMHNVLVSLGERAAYINRFLLSNDLTLLDWSVCHRASNHMDLEWEQEDLAACVLNTLTDEAHRQATPEAQPLQSQRGLPLFLLLVAQ